MTHRKILRAKIVMEITGYSRIQLWRKSRDADDEFPAPVQLSPTSKGAIGWHEDEISDWLANRPRVSYAPAPEGDIKAIADPEQKWLGLVMCDLERLSGGMPS